MSDRVPQDEDFLSIVPSVEQTADEISAAPELDPEEQRRLRPLKPLTYAEMKARQRSAAPYLIGSKKAPVLKRKGLFQYYGLPKSGKTYFSLGAAFCIAHGLPFHGLPVMQGRVAYVIAEGGDDNLGRLDALYAEHEVALREKYGIDKSVSLETMIEQLQDNGQLAWIDSAVNLTLNEEGDEQNPKSVVSLLGEIEQHRGDGEQFVAVFLDTWGRMLQEAGGHDSQPEIVNASLKGCDIIRNRLGSVVVFVSHIGVSKGAGDRPKGLSDTTANQDGSFRFVKLGELRDPIFTATAINMRHARDGYTMRLKLAQVGPIPEGEDEQESVLRLAPAPTVSRGLAGQTLEWFNVLEASMPAGLTETEWVERGKSIVKTEETDANKIRKTAQKSLTRAIERIKVIESTRERSLLRMVSGRYFVDDGDTAEEAGSDFVE
jgi:hypothetical protein